MYHYTDGGLRNVWLENGYIEKDTPYGKAVSFHDLDGLTKAICVALSNKPGKLTGAEFRYIRSGLLLSQKSLGKPLGCTGQAVAKWEKNGRVPKTADLVIRMIYKQAHDGKEGVGATVEMLNMIDRINHSRIIFSETHQQWTSKIED
jgi:DNA-binding transcriptional regulator YiaG